MRPVNQSLETELAHLRQADLGRTLAPLDPSLLDCSSNDYLGVRAHPAISSALKATLAEIGTGAGAARLISGTSTAHVSLERRIATWQQTEAALLFNSGYHANVGLISTLAGPEDLIFSDALNHASIIDGCRLSRARVHVYPHNDLLSLETALQGAPPSRRRLLITEGIFGMEGSRAPLAELAALARRYDCLFLVDDAHGVGALGPQGRGTTADIDVDVRMGTFGKALGSFGAYVAGSRTLIDLLINRARSFVFTTALPPALAAANEAAIDLVSSLEGDRLRARLAATSARLHRELISLRITTLREPSHITPLRLRVPTPANALAAARDFAAHGMFVHAIRPPTVPVGTSRLRLSLSASLAETAITRVVTTLPLLAHHFATVTS